MGAAGLAQGRRSPAPCLLLHSPCPAHSQTHLLSPPLPRYVFEPAAADKAATLKAVKEMRGR